MNKLSVCLIGLAILVCSIGVNAAAILDLYGPVYVETNPSHSGSMRCRNTAPYCGPHYRYLNRSFKKVIADYQPFYPPLYSWSNMGVWRVGHAAQGTQGLTTNDLNDIQNVVDRLNAQGILWRWADCNPGSAPTTICLR